MADKSLANLPKTVSVTEDDLLLVVDTPAKAPTNKKITVGNFFKSSKINYEETTAVTSDDLVVVVDNPAGTSANKKVSLTNLFNKIPTTIGYGTEAVGTVNVSDTTQALDGKAVFLCTGTGSATRVATMSDGDHVGQTITVILVGTAAAYVTYVQLDGEYTDPNDEDTYVAGTAGNNILLEDQVFTVLGNEYNISEDSADKLILDTEGTTPADFKITVSNLLAPSGSGDSVISIPSVGSSATLIWSGSNWIITSLIGDATTTT